MIDLGKQYIRGMLLTDEVKNEIVKRYWAELAPNYLYPSDGNPEKYNTFLPYLQKHIIDKALLYCESKEENFDIDKSESRTAIPFFMALTKNMMIGEKLSFVKYLLYISDNTNYQQKYPRARPSDKVIEYYDKLCKDFNRQHSLNQLV